MKFKILFLSLGLMGASLSAETVALNSSMGKVQLERSLHVPYSKLKDHYVEQQKNYSGVASSVMVLNTLGLCNAHQEAFNQQNFFTEPLTKIATAAKVAKEGMTFEELEQALNTFSGLNVKGIYASEFKSPQDLKNFLKEYMSKEQGYIIANFNQKALAMKGQGHYSPLGAFDEESNSILIVDVDPRLGSYWVSLDDFFKSIGTLNDQRHRDRGLIVLNK